MGTDKRERQKANRVKRREEELKAARKSAVRRNTARWVAIAVAALGAVVLIAWVGGAFGGDDEAPIDTTPLTLPPIDTAPDTATATASDTATATATSAP